MNLFFNKTYVLAIFFILPQLFYCGSTYSDEKKSIHILYPNESTSYSNAAKKLKEKLDISEKKLNIYSSSIKDFEKKPPTKNSLIVSIGSIGEDLLKKKGLANPILYTFIYNKTTANKNHPAKAEIQLNHPLQKFVDVAEKTIRNDYKKDIIIIVSEKNSKTINQIRKISPLKNGNLVTIKIKDGENIAKVIEKYLFNAATIIAVKDSKIWNNRSAGWILHQAYSYKVPVIGYSEAFLKAGAMISIHSSPEQIINETTNRIKKWAQKGKLENTITRPKYKIKINKNVAKALNFSSSIINEIEGEK